MVAWLTRFSLGALLALWLIVASIPRFDVMPDRFVPGPASALADDDDDSDGDGDGDGSDDDDGDDNDDDDDDDDPGGEPGGGTGPSGGDGPGGGGQGDGASSEATGGGTGAGATGASDGARDDGGDDRPPASGEGDFGALLRGLGTLLGIQRPYVAIDRDGDSREQEIVAGNLQPADLLDLIGAGYVVVEQAVTPALGLAPVRLRIPAGTSLAAARDEIAAITGSEVVDRNHLYRPQAAVCAERDCGPRELVAWAPSGDPAALCGGGATVGMVDTRVNVDHVVFRGSAVERLEIGSPGAMSDARHGTAVAALLVGAPTSGVPGLVPGARLLAVDPFASDRRETVTDAFEIALAVDRLVAAGADVINLSLAGPPNRLLEETLREAHRRDVVLVAAAGNGGPAAAPAYPAGYPEVVAVTAVDGRLQPYRRAQTGDYVELAAPGVAVPTAAAIRGVRPQTGTSFAAPFVTAAAAAIRAADRDLEPGAVRRRLRDGAFDLGVVGHDVVFGYGLLQASDVCAPGVVAR